MDKAAPISDALTLLVLVARYPDGVVTYKRFDYDYAAHAQCATEKLLFRPAYSGDMQITADSTAQDVRLHSAAPAEHKTKKCTVCLTPL